MTVLDFGNILQTQQLSPMEALYLFFSRYFTAPQTKKSSTGSKILPDSSTLGSLDATTPSLRPLTRPASSSKSTSAHRPPLPTSCRPSPAHDCRTRLTCCACSTTHRIYHCCNPGPVNLSAPIPTCTTSSCGHAICNNCVKKHEHMYFRCWGCDNVDYLYCCPDSGDVNPERCWWCGMKRGPESEEIWWGCGEKGDGEEGSGAEEALGRSVAWVVS